MSNRGLLTTRNREPYIIIRLSKSIPRDLVKLLQHLDINDHGSFTTLPAAFLAALASLTDVVQDRVDTLLRVVPRDGGLCICEKFGVCFEGVDGSVENEEEELGRLL